MEWTNPSRIRYAHTLIHVYVAWAVGRGNRTYAQQSEHICTWDMLYIRTGYVTADVHSCSTWSVHSAGRERETRGGGGHRMVPVM